MKDEEQKYWESLLVAKAFYRVHPFDYFEYSAYTHRVPPNLQEIRKTRELNEIFKVGGEDRKKLSVRFLSFWYGHDDVFDDVLSTLCDPEVEGFRKPLAYRPNELARCIGIHNDVVKGSSIEQACKDMAVDLNDGKSWHILKKLYQESLLNRIPNHIDPNISVSELRDQIYNFSLDRESSAENPELLVRENRNKIIFHEIEDNYPQKSSGDTEQLDLVYGNEKSGF